MRGFHVLDFVGVVGASVRAEIACPRFFSRVNIFVVLQLDSRYESLGRVACVAHVRLEMFGGVTLYLVASQLADFEHHAALFTGRLGMLVLHVGLVASLRHAIAIANLANPLAVAHPVHLLHVRLHVGLGHFFAANITNHPLGFLLDPLVVPFHVLQILLLVHEPFAAIRALNGPVFLFSVILQIVSFQLALVNVFFAAQIALVLLGTVHVFHVARDGFLAHHFVLANLALDQNFRMVFHQMLADFVGGAL